MKKFLIPTFLILLMPLLQSCFKDDDNTYEEWRKQNDNYIAALDRNEYELIVPKWAPQNSVYIKWHNDRSLTANNLVAMSNSTVDIKYQLTDIDGNVLDSSYSLADSTYRSRPNANIVGMNIAMTTMHVGDSATVVVPYPSGYGASQFGKVKPFSDLIFHMKIKSIKAFETSGE